MADETCVVLVVDDEEIFTGWVDFAFYCASFTALEPSRWLDLEASMQRV